MDEAGIQYIGFVYITPLPVLNSGKPLVIQREAEYCRARLALQAAEQRAVTQVKAAAAKWNAANRLMSRTGGLTERPQDPGRPPRAPLRPNQATLAQLLQARQRLIQLENAAARRPLAGHPGAGRPAPRPRRPLPHLRPPPGRSPRPARGPSPVAHTPRPPDTTTTPRLPR